MLKLIYKEEMEEIAKHDEMLKEVYEEMKLFSKRRYVNELFSKERLIESSHAEAMEDATKNTKLEIAENMLKEKIEVNLVSKTTNLSLDTILKLKNKLEG